MALTHVELGIGDARAGVDMHRIILVEPAQAPDFYKEYVTKVLLAATQHATCEVAAGNVAKTDNAVIVYYGFDRRPPTALQSAFDRSPGHSLVHLSNERLQYDVHHYRDARAVLRCYFDPRLRMDNVFVVPPGFQSGFLNNSPVGLEAKDLVWCFAGQVKSDRKKMLEEFAGLKPSHAQLTGQWNDPQGLVVNDMCALYQRSIFAPCPFGYRHPDSFRVMECLEYGCIPVVVIFLGDDYFRYVYGDHPFVVASTWAKAADQVRALLADPPALRERQRALVEWYARYKRDLALDVRDILLGARHGELRSSQFQHQKAGMRARMVRRYNLYFGHGLIRRLFRHYAHAFS